MAGKKLPLYRLIIEDTGESGVEAIAMVDEPATESEWIAFAKQAPHAFKIQSETQRIISGAFMIPDLPIYRVADGERPEHFIVFDKETVRKIALKFFKQGRWGAINMMHNAKAIPDGVFICESFFVDSTRGISAPEKFTGLPDGTWFGSFKVDSDEIWNEFVSTGLFTGFSVEGLFIYPPDPVSKEETMLRQIAELIK